MISSQESLTNICKESTILSLEFLENIFGKSTIHIYISGKSLKKILVHEILENILKYIRNSKNVLERHF